MILNTANQIAAQGIPRSSAKTQRARILRVLLDAKGSWVPLPIILELRISQFGARIFELRRTGFVIENKTERDDSGAVHSWYRLVSSPVMSDLERLNCLLRQIGLSDKQGSGAQAGSRGHSLKSAWPKTIASC